MTDWLSGIIIQSSLQNFADDRMHFEDNLKEDLSVLAYLSFTHTYNYLIELAYGICISGAV